ncbi:hypothetical protein HYC85_021796 [Camellia sinensis]|uniref:Uncharacterized protein n=1 Tax=Camellia sinensis TaxID=4442 RepID=A0A7J7GIK6_CAMSI|nr:hypothetical protein HYC85_021796 [Camellia sinensis]
MLQEPIENLVEEFDPRPICIITSNALPWTLELAHKFDIPRFIFHPISCFTLLCSHNISLIKFHKSHNSDNDSILKQFIRVELHLRPDEVAELLAQGVLVNSFEDLEMSYVQEYKKVTTNTWCIGPVSLTNKELLNKFDRSYKTSINEHHCLKWLDLMKPSSVIHACFGSLCHISPPYSGLKGQSRNLFGSVHAFRRASHSFISSAFASALGLEVALLASPLRVEPLVGGEVVLD